MSEIGKTELEKTDSEKSELEKFKERHSLEKLDGVMIYDKPTKTVLLQYDSDEDQLIAVNAGGELLVELLRKVEMEKLPLKKILKTFRLDHVSDHLWRLTYSYKKEDVVMEKSDR